MESGKISISIFLWIYTLRDVLNAICLFLENACMSVFFMLVVCMYLLQKIIAHSEELMNIIPPNYILCYILIGIIQLGLTVYRSTGDIAFL